MPLTVPKGLRGGYAGVDIFIFTMRKVIWNYLIEFIKLIVTLSAYRVPVTGQMLYVHSFKRHDNPGMCRYHFLT